MTDFNSDDWCDRMREAKNGKEIGELLDELPYRPASSPEEMPAASLAPVLPAPPEGESLR